VLVPLKYFFIIRSAAAYYAMTHHSKLGQLTHAEIDVLWGRASEKQKKRCIKEHKKRHKDYAQEYDEFIRVISSVPFLY
jgi:upstream-binding transcription factor